MYGPGIPATRRPVVLVAPWPGPGWVSIRRYRRTIAVALRQASAPFAANDRPWYGALLPRPLQKLRPLALPGGRAVHHFTDHALAYLVNGRSPSVVTIHDVMGLSNAGYPEDWLHRTVIERTRRPILLGLRRADALIAVSHFTAREAAATCDLNPARISVVPNMVDPRFRPREDAEAWLAARGVHLPPRPRVLSVGQVRTYKNLGALVAAMSLPGLAQANLVRVGDDLPPALRDQLARSGADGRYFPLGRVKTDVLTRLYNACDALVMPSTCEGFGLPVIEAQASGLSVVCSDGGALDEVAADSAAKTPLALEGDFPRAFAESAGRVLDDAAYREQLVAAGFTNVERFRAPAVLPELLAAYARADAAFQAR